MFKTDTTYFSNDKTFYNKNIVEYIVNAFGVEFLTLDRTIRKIILTEVNTATDYENKLPPYDARNTPDATPAKRVSFNSMLMEERGNYHGQRRKMVYEQEYNFLKKFIELIYNYFKGQHEWVNFMDLKMKELENIQKNRYNKELSKLLENLKDIIDKKEVIERRAFYVGVEQNGKTGEYSVSMYLDVVGGKIDRTNERKYRCIFRGEKLGNQFTTLWNGVYFEKERFYVDIENAAAEAATTDAAEAATTTTEPIPAAAAAETPKSETDFEKEIRRRNRQVEFSGGKKYTKCRRRRRHIMTKKRARCGAVRRCAVRRGAALT
jgi:hypothetical protein